MVGKNIGYDLWGKNVLVTGGSGGIWSEIVRLFVSCGANVGIHYQSNRSVANALQKELSQDAAVKVELFRGDLLNHRVQVGLIL